MMWPHRLPGPQRGHRRHGRQLGAAALEFALLFTLFFAVLYGIIGYSVMFLLQQGLTQAAAEGARVALRLDPSRFASSSTYQTAVGNLARDAAANALSWLPAIARDKIISGNQIATSWAPGSKTVVTGGTPLVIPTMTLTVTVTYPDYAKQPLVPAITFPKFGDASPFTLPVMPAKLVGSASIQVQS